MQTRASRRNRARSLGRKTDPAHARSHPRAFSNAEQGQREEGREGECTRAAIILGRAEPSRLEPSGAIIRTFANRLGERRENYRRETLSRLSCSSGTALEETGRLRPLNTRGPHSEGEGEREKEMPPSRATGASIFVLLDATQRVKTRELPSIGSRWGCSLACLSARIKLCLNFPRARSREEDPVVRYRTRALFATVSGVDALIWTPIRSTLFGQLEAPGIRRIDGVIPAWT